MNNILQKLDVNKSCGHDDISPILLKCFPQYLSPSLCSLFNRSLRGGVLPNDWLKANVCPVYKGKGDKNCVNNNRPISLVSVVSKVAERCIYNNVISVMDESIFKGQHGFMKEKSTTTQLTQIFHLIGESVDNHGQVVALYLDFSKAFDRVLHHLLLHKMKMSGFNGNLLKWFTSYLSGRKQRVTISGSTSEWLSVTSGVPQGSILGPLFFFNLC